MNEPAGPLALGTRPARKHLVELHLAVLLFGATGLFGKLVDLPPGPLVLARSSVAAAFVLAVALALGERPVLVRRADAAAFAGLGTLLALHWVAFYRSVQISTVSIAVLMVATFPIFTALLEALVSRRRPRRLDLGLAATAFVGIALIVGRIDLDGAVTLGVLWGATASGLFAVLTVVNERLVSGYPGRTVALYQFAFAALTLAPFTVTGFGSAEGLDWVYLALFGTVFTGVPHTLFISCMRAIPSQTASLTVGLEPMYGVLFAWLILSERPGLRTLLGGAVVLATVTIGTRIHYEPTGAARPPAPADG